MPTADHGDFDLVVEVATTAITSAIRSGFTLSFPPTQVSLPELVGQVIPQASVSDVSLASNGDITITITIDGTILRADRIVIGGSTFDPPEWLRDIRIDGTVRVTDRVEQRGLSVIVDFTPTPVLGHPRVEPNVDERAVLASPLIAFYLAQQILQGPVAYQEARRQLMAQINDRIAAAVKSAVQALGVQTLVPAPPAPVTRAALLVSPASLRLLYTLGGAPGNPAAITRSRLLLGSSGVSVDAAAITLNNGSLLRDFVRPAVAGALTIPTTAFTAGHPCFFAGSPIPLPLPGGLPPGIVGATTNFVIAGIDETGALRIILVLRATGVGGTFTLTASIDMTVAISATTSGGTTTMTIAMAGPPAVTSDVEIPAWVYVAAALTGGTILVGVLAAVDAFAGGFAAGAIGGIITGGFTPFTVGLPFPSRLPPLIQRSFGLNQADAPRRVLQAPGVPFTIPDPFRAHDLFLKFV
jgi:hypothetical protein